jgi:DNA-binding GntR family transcriptional regulator
MDVMPHSVPLPPRTRAEAIATELRRAILAGELAPGERLRQAEIAERYGVSTTPVREAFTALAGDGLVRQDAHRGVVVFSPSVEEVTETYEIRGALEALAVRLATPALTNAALADLDELVGRMAEASPADYAELNREFHDRIYAAAGRRRLQGIITSLRERSYSKLATRRFDPAYRDQVHSEHKAILAALQARAVGEAVTLVSSHLEHNARHVAALVLDCA